MPQSLSVVLPVNNAQATLQRTVVEILDIVPELTENFEVLIVDDASRDLTEEIACDLGQKYPQVAVVRHRENQGVKHAIQTGIQQSRGDVIFVKDDAAPIRPSDLRSLWNLRSDDQLVMAKTQKQAPIEPKPLSPDLVQRLMQWGAALESATEECSGGLQMIRRQAAQKMDEDVRIDPSGGQDFDADNREADERERVSRSDQIRRRMPPRPIPVGGGNPNF